VGRTVLLEALEEKQLLLGSPVVVVEGEIEAVDDVILGGVLVEVGEAAEAVVGLAAEDLDGLGDVPLALVALYLVGGVEYVLHGEGRT
jgi:hypothetical protein